ncbi:FAD/NAD(P)-dependent oxidoreductase [Microvirga alba]|uniref:FAD-dependent oxidoreductase n=1 Tax=Microvirga alba TaxID=2791025 RepID=A0A931FPZ9_9HYPH|nr:FAD/NAD(P)-binding oxidoreductase [Microvirga alba]MBF9235325.1 FAD-dependent oxidoreductase [Microvirga alba]
MTAPRIIVVGAGPAGIRAAQTLVEAGVRPVVIDEGEASGGQIYRRQPNGFKRDFRQLYGTEHRRARDLHETFDALREKMDYRPRTLAWNLSEGALHIVHNGISNAVPFDGMILATGATDRLLPVRGWTTPGVYSLGASQIALKAQACAIGRRVVFIGTGPLLYLVATQYLKAGAEVAAVLDTSAFGHRLAALPLLLARPDALAKGLALIAQLRLAGITMLTGIRPIAIEAGADRNVARVHVRDARGRDRNFMCDAVAMGYHLRPETQLADLARCDFSFDPATHLWSPMTDAMGRTSVRGIYVAGDGVKISGADAAEIAGRLAAHAAIADLHSAHPAGRGAEGSVKKLLTSHRRMDRFRRGLAKGFPWPAHLAEALPDDTILCRCESVTVGSLRMAATALGAPEVNRAKAFVRVGMGRCQGRFCGPASAEILAAVLGKSTDGVGRLRGQAPVKPLPIATVPEDAS